MSAVDTSANGWKASDADWFAAHPFRSHRLRPLLSPDEAEQFFAIAGEATPKAPPGYELQVLIRQVAPGLRVRQMFFRRTTIPIPDDEAIARALFNIIAQNRPADTWEVAELAERFERGARS